jgi:hypothetical protein
MLTAFTFVEEAAQVAVDNSGGSTDGVIYVTNNVTGERVVKVYARTGALIGLINGSTTPDGKFGGTAGTGSNRFPTGVAVSPNGTLYISSGLGGKVFRYVPSPGDPFAGDDDYDAQLNFIGVPGALAADSQGNLFAQRIGTTGVERFTPSQFGAPGAQPGVVVDATSASLYLDPLSDHLYTNNRDSINEYDASGTLLDNFGSGIIGPNLADSRGSTSFGVAVQGSADGTTSRIYAVDSRTGNETNRLHTFDSRIAAAAEHRVDNPLIVHAVNAPGVRRSADFQITPDGRYAAFATTMPLTGYDNGGFVEVFRYDTVGDTFVCASCRPTGARSGGSARLAPGGLSLTDDGRVFFNSDDAEVPRDLNNRQDVYQWEPDHPPLGTCNESNGCLELISTGSSPFDSSLLGTSADGTDAFFFTKETLVRQDQNGNLVKLYDARAGGGFLFVPPLPLCKASDECHGAGSQPPAPLGIATITGQNPPAAKRCPRGKVKRGNRCVRKKSAKKKQRSRRKHRKGAKKPGGSK